MAKTPIVPSTTVITFENIKAREKATIVPINPNNRFPSWIYKIAGKISAPSTA